MRVIRWGFKKMWQEVPSLMRKYNIGQVDSFDKLNAHGGKIWGWPKECHLTSTQAGKILLAMYRRRTLTFPALKAVRKSLAYAYELSDGTISKGNFKGVSKIWEVVLETECKPSGFSQRPERIPQPSELKDAFSSPWTPDHPWSLMEFVGGANAASDLFVFGLRSREDVRRVKESLTHEIDIRNGWQCTKFVGGRCKLSGSKKNSRPWWIWRVCLCSGKKHVAVPEDFGEKIGNDGNPYPEYLNFEWSNLCPLNQLQLMWQLQDTPSLTGEPRCYGKWLGDRFGLSNHGDVAKFAINWLRVQLGLTTSFDTNAGRKSLAGWCKALNIEYDDSFPIHGDTYDVWRENYENQAGGPRPSGHKSRSQPRNPRVACAGLRKIALYLGAGRKIKVGLTRRERFEYNLLKALGHKKKAEKIRLGLPSSSDESSSSSDEPPKTSKRPRKRARVTKK